MQDFDINKVRMGYPVVTRCGLKARIICYDRIDPDCDRHIVALVFNPTSGREDFFYYDDKGHYSCHKEGYFDLMIGEK